MFHITKFTLNDSIYPIECTHIIIEGILWPRQILRVHWAVNCFSGQPMCSPLFIFVWENGSWVKFSSVPHSPNLG